MHTAFISYSSEDKNVAFGVCRALEAGGVICWIAPRDVMAGRPYSGQISEAIRKARAFVLVLSQKSDQSRQVLREVERAAHSRLHILAFRIEDFEPSDNLGYFLSVEHWLNAYEGISPETHFPELLQHTSALVREDRSEAQGEEDKPKPDAEPAGTQKFANYYILKRPDGTLSRLGAGAMGVTYKAFDTSLDRHVALKVIAADLLGSDEARRRFLREARAAAKIQHPHVAAIYHLGQEGDDYFYTMELVDGEDMERYVQAHGPLSPRAALWVVLQVAQALEAAQVHKLIHRDIKPANIMARVNRAGQMDVKLIDFGLAKGAGPGSQDLSLVTHTVSFVGSPSFASPEQCELGELDTRSDIYSLGATLWYLLTGKPPFAGNVNQVLIAHATKSPPFDQLRGTPVLVIELLRQMLAKNPADRLQSPQDLQQSIERAAANVEPDFEEAPERTATESTNATSEGRDLQTGESGGSPVLLSRLLDAYLQVDLGVLIGERYRLEEEQREGNGGRLFVARDEKAGTGQPAQVALKLLHPEIASDSVLLELVGDEIDVVSSIQHPNLLGNFILQRGMRCFVRDWVHGFLLYDLLRMRGSFRPEEVVTLLESFAATLDFVSEKGLGLVEVSIRKLLLSCPAGMRPDQLQSFALGNVKGWTSLTLKLNPISLAPLIFRERRDWSSRTLVPSSRVLSMTQVEAGIRGIKAVRLLARLVHELIRGHSPSLGAHERPSPLPLLSEAGNQVLWKACALAGDATPFRNCQEFWTVFKESVSNRVRPPAASPAKPEGNKSYAETPKVVNPLPPKPTEPTRGKLPASLSDGTAGKSRSKHVIAFFAIAAVLMLGGVIYLVIRLSYSPSPQSRAVASVTPSPLVIATPAVEEKAPPTQEVTVQPSAQPTAPPAVAIPSPSTSAMAADTERSQSTTPYRDTSVRGLLTIATVNNPAMIELKKLSTSFEENYPNIELNWVIIEDNILRQRVTTDVSTGSGQFDLVFIGLFETPIFAKRGWLKEMGNIPADYDIDDVFKSIRDGLSYQGKLYALPFYGESSMLMYRKDLLDDKGLSMPDQPTYDDIKKFADALTDKEKGIYGITLRGKPGWGENMAYLGTLINTFGGTWFDMQWHPTIDTREWKKAIAFYVDLMRADGPPGASSNGFNENLALFESGKAAMWIDATSAGGPLYDKAQSQVSDKVAFAPAPIDVTPNGSHWLWSWAFAIPKAAKNSEAAEKFALWATSKAYIKLVADDSGWAVVPPGTRKSTYAIPDYQKAAPFAAVTLQAMQTTDPTDPCIKPVPYTGVQFVVIPEFQSFGGIVGQNISGALAGRMTVDQALKESQAEVTRVVRQAGYPKK